MRHRHYNATLHGKFPGLNYSHERPFRNWKSAHLNTLIGGWLKSNPPCLELATMAYDDLLFRGEELTAAMKFADAELEPIAWLGSARSRIQKTFTTEILKKDKKGRLAGSVYVILRGGYTEGNGWYGVYVGSTGRSIEQRFKEHRTSSRAGRGLIAHGIEPLYSLFERINPVPVKRSELQEWETRLHEALAPVIPKVTGDVAF